MSGNKIEWRTVCYLKADKSREQVRATIRHPIRGTVARKLPRCATWMRSRKKEHEMGAGKKARFIPALIELTNYSAPREKGDLCAR